MRNLNLYVIILTTSYILLACNNSSSNTKETGVSFDLAKETEWVKNEVIKFSNDFKKGDSTALASYYSSDVIVMPPNMESVKKKDLASMWGEAIRMGVKDIKLNVTEVKGIEDLLLEVGTYEMYGDINVLLEKGKYMSALKKENGIWKVFRDIWNTNAPPAPAK